MAMSDAIRWYDTHATEVATRYESVAAQDAHSWLTDRLPKAPGLVLDIGAGTGRDAAWLPAELKARLDDAAEKAGRSQGEEAARRLQSSFELQPIKEIITIVETVCGKSWRDDGRDNRHAAW